MVNWCSGFSTLSEEWDGDTGSIPVLTLVDWCSGNTASCHDAATGSIPVLTEG